MTGAIDFLADIMTRGGPVMWPIAACSVVSVLVIIKKAVQWGLFRLSIDRAAGAWGEAVRALAGQKREEQIETLRRNPSPYARIVLGALKHPELEFAEALEAEAQKCVRKLASGLGVLDTIVTLAPMLGILGTVTGIISSFQLMGASGSENPTGIAAGIAEALITTAAGLVVSMVALLPFNAGKVWHRALVLRIQEAMTAIERVMAEEK